MSDQEMQVYEVGFHIDPNLSDTAVAAAYEAVKSIVSGHGTLVAEGVPRQVSLTYTISERTEKGRRDYTTAQFAWIAYEGAVSDQKKLEEALGGEENLIRFIIVKTTREAAKHAEERELARAEEIRTESEGGGEGEGEEETGAPVEAEAEHATV